MWTIAAAGLLAISAIDVDVQLLSGEKVAGKLTAIDDDQITLATPEGPKKLKFRQLIGVIPKTIPQRSQEEVRVWLHLVGGSQLLGKSYTVAKRVATIELLSGTKLKIPTRSVKHVRFRSHSEVLRVQWREMITAKISGDVIVIRRSAESLDQLVGVVNEVTDEKVHFVLNEKMIPVNRARLDGVIYYHAVGRQLPAAVCQLLDGNGNFWSARSLKLTDQGLAITTTSNDKITLPIDQVATFDFSAGNIVYVSDMEPESIRWTPRFGTKISSEARMYAPQRNRGLLFDGEKLRLGNREFAKGLAIHSRTEIVYRLTNNFKNFHTIAGIDDRVGDDGNVELVITGDKRELFRKTITGADEPLPIHLKIDGVKRLKILVDYGEKSDVADHLNLCRVRITK